MKYPKRRTKEMTYIFNLILDNCINHVILIIKDRQPNVNSHSKSWFHGQKRNLTRPNNLKTAELVKSRLNNDLNVIEQLDEIVNIQLCMVSRTQIETTELILRG